MCTLQLHRVAVWAVYVCRCIQALKDYQDAWRTLQWTATSCTDVRADAIWTRTSGNTFAHVASVRGLEMYQVPSKIKGIPEKRWIIEDIGFHICGYEIDDRQDLLIAIEDP